MMGWGGMYKTYDKHNKRNKHSTRDTKRRGTGKWEDMKEDIKTEMYIYQYNDPSYNYA